MLTEEKITTSKVQLDWPVTVDRAKRHLHVDITDNDEDDYILSLIKAVTDEAASYIGKDIAYTRNTVNMYDFSGDKVKLWEGNFESTISVVSDASVSQTVSFTFPYYNYFELELSASVTSDPLEVKFYTGWEQENCPAAIKHAVLLRVKDYYDIQRGSMNDFSLYNTMAFERLLGPYKNTRF